MANALTSMDHAYWSRQQNNINQIQSKIKNDLKKDKNESFAKMLDDKIKPGGKIEQNKLTKKEKKLYNTCVEMESLFWKQVLNSMKKTINKYKLLDGGQAEEFFTDFLYDEYAMILAKNSSSNIADDMFKQLADSL